MENISAKLGKLMMLYQPADSYIESNDEKFYLVFEDENGEIIEKFSLGKKIPKELKNEKIK